MTDLLQALPDFDVGKFSHLLPSLDRHHVTLSDLLTLDAVDIAKRAQVPPGEVRKLADAALGQLHAQLGIRKGPEGDKSENENENNIIHQQWETISTLDQGLDNALGGGIPTRYLTEIVGESGAGKTQFLLSLLLAVQLPADHGGLASRAVYISTEATLSTSRLSQLIRANPRVTTLPADQKPSLNRILTMQTPDLESQDHILRYQLPVAIKRHGIRIVVIDSIAANYRVEFDRKGGSGGGGLDFDAPESAQDRKAGGKAMAARRAHLIQLGAHLRDLARKENIAVVVANQVADRFFGGHAPPTVGSGYPVLRDDVSVSQPNDHISPASSRTLSTGVMSRTPSAGSSTAPPAVVIPPPQQQPHHHDPLTLDHQQRFFTGWGDVPVPPSQLKTPSLGLVWANQLACRIALTRDPGSGSGGWSQGAGMKGRRWMRVVFSAWCAPTDGKGVNFEIWGGGVRAVKDDGAQDGEVEAEGTEKSVKRARLDDIDDGTI